MSSFAGLEETSQPAGPPHALLFIKPAEQYFSLTTNQPKQCFSANFQTSERTNGVWLVPFHPRMLGEWKHFY